MVNKYLAMTAFFCSSFAIAAPSTLDILSETALQTEVAKQQTALNKALAEANAGLSLPSIVSLSVSSAGALAQLSFQSGMVRLVKLGDEVQPGVYVASITSSGVTVRSKGRTTALGFSSLDSDGQGASIVMMPPPIRYAPAPAAPKAPVVPAPEEARP